MELSELLRALRRFWPLALGVIVAAVALGVAAAYLPNERFRSTATVIVTPASKRIDYATADTIRYLLPSIAAQANSQTFAGQVRDRLESTTPWNGVDLQVSDEPGTSVLRIQAEAFDPVVASRAANAATDNLIERKVSSLVNFQIIDRARPPGAAFSPDRPLILFAMFAIGLILAVLAAVAANALRPRVRSAREIRQKFGLEILGEIPNTKGFPLSASRVFDPKAGHHHLVEAFQRLRANLEIVAGESNAIAVTSATAGEGKSAVTANAAYAIAAMGQEVVAVDTDLRRPTLHEYFHIRPGIGVADVPLGVDIKQLAQPTSLPQLRVIAAGYATQHPTSILHSAVPKILEAFPDAMLVIDMPPVLATADAVLVATMAKSVVLVTDARHGDPAELEQVLLELDRARANVLGVVLNRTPVGRLGRAEVYYSDFARRQSGVKQKGFWGRLFPGGSKAKEQPASPVVATTFPRAAPAEAADAAVDPLEGTATSQRARRA